MGSDALDETIRGFFRQDGWTIADGAGDPAAVRAIVETEAGRWSLGVWVTEDERIVVYSTIGDTVPTDRRAAVVALLGELNDGMILGNFELDHEDGLVRFRTSIGVRETDVTEPLLRELVYPNIATVDEYLPSIVACISG